MQEPSTRKPRMEPESYLAMQCRVAGVCKYWVEGRGCRGYNLRAPARQRTCRLRHPQFVNLYEERTDLLYKYQCHKSLRGQCAKGGGCRFYHKELAELRSALSEQGERDHIFQVASAQVLPVEAPAAVQPPAATAQPPAATAQPPAAAVQPPAAAVQPPAATARDGHGWLAAFRGDLRRTGENDPGAALQKAQRIQHIFGPGVEAFFGERLRGQAAEIHDAMQTECDRLQNLISHGGSTEEGVCGGR